MRPDLDSVDTALDASAMIPTLNAARHRRAALWTCGDRCEAVVVDEGASGSEVG